MAAKKRNMKLFVEKVVEEQPKASKYNNKHVLLTDGGIILKPEHLIQIKRLGIVPENGEMFDSELEAEYYRDVLMPQVLAGKIQVQRQPKFVLLEGFTKDGVTYRPATYSPDFLVKNLEDGSTVAIDVKGFQTGEFLLRKKMFDYFHRNVKLLILKRVHKYGGWITVEEYAAHKRRERNEYRSLSSRTQRRTRK